MGVAMASAGPYANHMHLSTQFFTGQTLLLTPNQQVKALKAYGSHAQISKETFEDCWKPDGLQSTLCQRIESDALSCWDLVAHIVQDSWVVCSLQFKMYYVVCLAYVMESRYKCCDMKSVDGSRKGETKSSPWVIVINALKGHSGAD